MKRPTNNQLAALYAIERRDQITTFAPAANYRAAVINGVRVEFLKDGTSFLEGDRWKSSEFAWHLLLTRLQEYVESAVNR